MTERRKAVAKKQRPSEPCKECHGTGKSVVAGQTVKCPRCDGTGVE